MGLFGGGNSKSYSTTNVTNTSQNTSFSELGGGQALALQGHNNSINILDGGAIRESFDFGESALSFAEQNNRQSIQLASAVAENAGRQTQEAVKAVSESVRTGAENIFQQAGTIAGFALAAWVAVKVFRG